MRALPLVAMLLLAGCATAVDEPTVPAPPMDLPDPLGAGDRAFDRLEWQDQVTLVAGPGTQRYVVDLHGSLHIPDGDGPFPSLVFMHGRHGTCALGPGGFEFLLQPCPDAPPATAPVDSYTGYDYLAEQLASHGFIVVSVSANNINDHDNTWAATDGDYGATARGRIILDLLADLQAAADGGGPDAFASVRGKVDASRFGIMGHSRGGEGVARAQVLNVEEGHGLPIDAVFALAPTDFAHWEISETPLGVLLPYCDGDVSNLQGAWMYDEARTEQARHLFLAMGANHNFYNTVWTRDDWGGRTDPHCNPDVSGSGRDAPDEQRAHGLWIMSTFFRAYVGGDGDLLPYLTGAAASPAGDVKVAYQPPMDASSWVMPTGHHKWEHVVTEGLQVSDCFGTRCPAQNTYAWTEQARVEWDGDARMVFFVPEEDDVLVVRMAVDPSVTTLDVQVRVDGTVRPITDFGAYVPPGDEYAKTVLTDVRIPYDEGPVALSFSGEGALQVATAVAYSSSPR